MRWMEVDQRQMVTIEASKFHDALTLRDLAQSYRNLQFKCSGCGLMRQFVLADLVALYGGETRLGYVRRNTSCDKCS